LVINKLKNQLIVHDLHPTQIISIVSYFLCCATLCTHSFSNNKKGDVNMDSNISRIDAYCRIAMGTAILACSTAKLVRKPFNTMAILGTMMGGMKVAEGATKFCPIVYLSEQGLDIPSIKEEFCQLGSKE